MDEAIPDDDNSYLEDEAFNDSDSPGDRTVKMTILNGIPIATLNVQGVDMLCLAQISATILQKFSYNEIHNRRVALSISTKPCNASQMEVLRCAGAVPPSSRRCGLITRHEAERLVRSFTEGTRPPNLPAGFAFDVGHNCGWGCRGRFYVEKYTSSRAKCIECTGCDEVLAPNKFIFHSHRPRDFISAKEPVFRPADAANFNSWRRHIFLINEDLDSNVSEAWEDVKALFNGGNRQNVNVLTMTTLVSASVGAGTSTAGTTGDDHNSITETSHSHKRSKPATFSPTSSSGNARNCKQPCTRSKSSVNSIANNKQQPSSLLVRATIHKQQQQQQQQQQQLTVDDVIAHSNSDFDYSNHEVSPPVSQCLLPTASSSFAPPQLTVPPLVAGANLWLVDTLFRSFLTQQATAAASTLSSLPMYNSEVVAPTAMFNAEQIAALNLVKQKWTTQLAAQQSAQVPTSEPTSSNQFLIKNIVGMNDD